MNFKSINKKLISAFVILAMMLPFGISAAFAAETAVSLGTDTITLGQSVDITVTIGVVDIKDENLITVTVNEKLVLEEIMYGEEYTFTYTPTEAGNHTIAVGGASATLTVEGNTAPTVTLAGYLDGQLVRTQILDGEVLEASAIDDDIDDEVEKIEIIVGGKVIASEEDDEISIPFSEIGLGTYDVEVVAYDSFGLSGMAGIQAIIVNEKESSVVEIEQKKSSYITFRDGRAESAKKYAGFAEIRTLEDDNAVLAMGIDETCDAGQSNSDFSMVDLSITNYVANGGVLSMEFDLNYAVPMQKAAAAIRFQIRERLSAGTNDPYIINVETDSSLRHFVTMQQGSKPKYEINPGEWYHIKLAIDWKNNRMSAYITGEDGEENVIANNIPCGLGKEINGKMEYGTLEHIRMHTMRPAHTPDNYNTVYFDKFRFATLYTPPTITSVSEESSATSTIVRVNLDNCPIGNTITTDTVYLLDSDGNKVVPKSVNLDAENKVIEIEMANTLTPGATYHVVLDKTIKMTKEFALGADIKKEFAVSNAECYDAGDAKWYSIGDHVYCKTTIVNSSEEPVDVYILRSVWYLDDDGNNVAKTIAEPYTVNPGSEPITRCFEGAKSGDCDMYIISDINDPYVYSVISK